MVQLNLLPDIKLKYVKAERTRRLVVSTVLLVAGIVAVIVVILAMTVLVAQRRHINNLDKDIQQYATDLTGTEDINKILTVQNQLEQLTALHESKPQVTRLFSYISRVTPSDVTLSQMQVNFQENTIVLTGSGSNIESINKYADTLKFTTIEGEEDSRAFPEVVLTSFSRTDTATTYTITSVYNPILFDSTSSAKLIVPNNLITTRSEVEKPDTLFRQTEETE